MKPVLQALVLAEHIYETADGRKIICGTFTGVILEKESQPATGTSGQRVLRGGIAGSPYAYLSLADVCDQTKLELQFVSLKRNKVLFSQQLMIRNQDRLATIELVSALPHFHVGEAGTYAFEVVCDNEILGSHRINVEVREGNT